MAVIVGISGKLWSGKDTFAGFLAGELDRNFIRHEKRSFADALKEEAAHRLHLSTPSTLLAFLKWNGCKNAKQIVSDIYGPHTWFEKLASLCGCYFPPTTSGKYHVILEEMYDPVAKKRFRTLLQWWGTEYRRAQFDQDYWINKLKEYAAASNKDVIVVPDVRFLNEAALCTFVVRIERPGIVREGDAHFHESETALDNYTNFDLVVQNSEADMSPLIEAAKEVVRKIKV